MRGFFLVFLSFITTFAIAQGDFEFVPNQGQFHKNVLYRADIPSGALFLEQDGITFSFYDGEVFHEMHHGEKVEKVHFHAYKMKFVGANFKSSTKLNHLNKGLLNYYLGSDSSKWVSGLKGGGEVFYKNIYEGIDFKIYTKNGSLKYDFIVHSGADPNEIKMTYYGLDDLSKRGDDLFLFTSLGTITDSEPVAFQNKEIVDVSFNLKGNTVGFELDKYNKDEDLVIDPTLVFSTYSGSFANNFGFTATYDEEGNLYAGGSVFSLGYPTTTGAYDLTFNSSSTSGSDGSSNWGISDIGITKYSANGKSRLYSSYLGGNRCEVPHSLIVNNRDELFVLGTTSSDNYPVTVDAFDLTFNGGDTANLANGIFINYTHGSDIVISRFSSDGSALLASTYVGGSKNDGLNLNEDLVANYADQMRGEIILDDFENIIVGSSSASVDFPITPSGLQTIYGGGEQDGVVFKIDENLSSMIWSSYLGGDDADGIYSVINSKSSGIYVAGGTKSQNISFPLTAYQNTYQGGITDGFYAKLSITGDDMLQGSYFGSDRYDQIYFVREDDLNQIYFFGQSDKFGSYWIKNADYNTPNSGQFISKMELDQNNIEWSTTFGSGDNKINISPTAFMVDLCNKIYLSGWGSNSSGFDGIGGNIADGTMGMEVTPDAYKSTTLGHDFYLMVLEDDASSLIYGSFFGGDDSGEHVDGGTSRFDNQGVMYQSVCAGCGGNNDFPIEPFDAVSPTNNSSCNNGVFKFDFGIPMVVADFQTPPVACFPETILFINKSKILSSTSFLWDFGDGTYGTDTNPSHVYTQPGHYEVVLKVTDSTACNFADSVSKNILILGSELENELNEFSCNGLNIQIGVTPYPDTPVTYKWFPSSGLSDSSIANPIANVDSSQKYQLVISGNSCTDTMYQNIIISEFDLETFGDTNTCNLTTEYYIYNESKLGLIHHWSTNNRFSDTLLYGFDSNEYIAEPTDGENYFYVKVEDSIGCYDIDSVFLGVYEYDVSYESNVNVCLNDSIEVFPVGYESYDSVNFNWGPSPLLISSINDTNAVLYGVDLDNYSVPVTSTSAYGCSDTDSIYVTIKYSDTEVKAFGDTIVCNFFPLITLYDETDANLIHHWSSDNNFTDTLLYGLNESEINLETIKGENYVFIKVIDSVSCFAIDSVFIGAYDYDLSYQKDLIICLNDSIKVFPLGYENYDSVNFNWGPSPLLTSSVDDTIAVFEGISPGFYSIPVTSTSAYSCSDTDYVNVRVSSFDTTTSIKLTTNFDTLINNEEAILTVLPEGFDYTWSPADFVGEEYGNNAEVVINQSTLFTVQISDPLVDNCLKTDSVFIVFIDSKCEDPYVYVPNAFSPNDDGENDVLYVRGRNITDLYFAIFNRWGEKVFETNDQSIGWDGLFRNRNSDPAVFDYYLKYFCDGNKQYFQKGNVTLIR